MMPFSLNIPRIIDHLSKHFIIVKVINLVEYDWRPHELYEELKKLNQNSFTNKERIIFIFGDTEYYLGTYGFTLHNLQKILIELNIANYFCIILTHQSFISESAKFINDSFVKDDFPISVFEVYLDQTMNIDKINTSTELNFNAIEKSYILLSGTARTHKIIFFSLLDDTLKDKGIISFSINNGKSNLHDSSSRENSKIQFLSTTPYTRCKEDWHINDKMLSDTYNKFLNNITGNYLYKNFVEEKDPKFVERNDASYVIPFIQKSFLYIAAETVFVYPGSFISEKSLKGIAAKRPFLMLGPPGNLKKLKAYGFKTFDHWWDESYDLVTDPCQRILLILDIVKNLASKSNLELMSLASDMEDVLQYNFDYLINHFAKSQLSKLSKNCINNANLR